MTRPRIGHNMRRTCVYVAENPGKSIIEVARALAPVETFFLNTASGAYATVHACIKQGLIYDTEPDLREYSLKVTRAGMAMAIADGATP